MYLMLCPDDLLLVMYKMHNERTYLLTIFMSLHILFKQVIYSLKNEKQSLYTSFVINAQRKWDSTGPWQLIHLCPFFNTSEPSLKLPMTGSCSFAYLLQQGGGGGGGSNNSDGGGGWVKTGAND